MLTFSCTLDVIILTQITHNDYITIENDKLMNQCKTKTKDGMALYEFTLCRL